MATPPRSQRPRATPALLRWRRQGDARHLRRFGRENRGRIGVGWATSHGEGRRPGAPPQVGQQAASAWCRPRPGRGSRHRRDSTTWGGAGDDRASTPGRLPPRLPPLGCRCRVGATSSGRNARDRRRQVRSWRRGRVVGSRPARTSRANGVTASPRRSPCRRPAAQEAQSSGGPSRGPRCTPRRARGGEHAPNAPRGAGQLASERDVRVGAEESAMVSCRACPSGGRRDASRAATSRLAKVPTPSPRPGGHESRAPARRR